MGSLWGRFWIDFGSILGRFGVGLGSIWGRFGISLGSIWGRFGVDLGSIWQIWGKLGVFAEFFVRKGIVRKGGPTYGQYICTCAYVARARRRTAPRPASPGKGCRPYLATPRLLYDCLTIILRLSYRYLRIFNYPRVQKTQGNPSRIKFGTEVEKSKLKLT